MSRLFGVYDIGSGLTKFQLVKLTLRPLKFDILLTRSKILTLGHDVQKSKRISDGMLKKCEEAISEMKNEAMVLSKNSEQIAFVGFGTEVLRVAENGIEFLNDIKTRYNIELKLVSQEKEAKIGFFSAKAALLAATGGRVMLPENAVVWDSGGGSFQFSQAQGEVLSGKLGSSVVTGYLADIKLRHINDQMNPVTEEEYFRLKNKISSYLKSDKKFNANVLNNMEVVAIGDYISVFACLHLLKKEVLLKNNDFVTLQDVKDIEPMVLNRTSKYFSDLGIHQVEMLVPKVALAYCVMDALKINQFRYIEAMGGCLGYLYLNLLEETEKSNL